MNISQQTSHSTSPTRLFLLGLGLSLLIGLTASIHAQQAPDETLSIDGSIQNGSNGDSTTPTLEDPLPIEEIEDAQDTTQPTEDDPALDTAPPSEEPLSSILVNPVPENETLDPSTETLDPSAETLDPSVETLDSLDEPLDPSADTPAANGEVIDNGSSTETTTSPEGEVSSQSDANTETQGDQEPGADEAPASTLIQINPVQNEEDIQAADEEAEKIARANEHIEAYNMGISLYNQGAYNNAIDIFRRLLDEEDLPFSKNELIEIMARAHTRMAYVLENGLGGINEAKEAYLTAISLFDQLYKPYKQVIKELYSFAHNRLGGLIYNNEYIPEDDTTLPALQTAFNHFNEAININKENSSAYNNKGIAYSIQGDSLPAIGAYTRAIEYNRNNVVAYLNRGTDYFFADRLEAALSDFKEVVRYQDLSRVISDPDEVAAATLYAQEMIGFTHLRLGNDLYHKGFYEEAIKNYTLAFEVSSELGPRSPSLASLRPNMHLYLGTAHAQLREFNNARSEFQLALNLNPNSADAYNNLGILLYEEGNFDRAIEAYTQALDRNPGLSEAYLNRGNAHARLDQIDDARRDYDSARSLGLRFRTSAIQTPARTKRTPSRSLKPSTRHVYADISENGLKSSTKKVFLLF